MERLPGDAFSYSVVPGELVSIAWRAFGGAHAQIAMSVNGRGLAGQAGEEQVFRFTASGNDRVGATVAFLPGTSQGAGFAAFVSGDGREFEGPRITNSTGEPATVFMSFLHERARRTRGAPPPGPPRSRADRPAPRSRSAPPAPGPRDGGVGRGRPAPPARSKPEPAPRTTPEKEPEPAPRWILARVVDLSAGTPSSVFRAGAPHEIDVMIGSARQGWITALLAQDNAASQSIDSVLPKGTHQLTVVFFIPDVGTQTGSLTLPPTGPTPEPATFRFEVGEAGTMMQALVSIVYRGRVLQTALLSGKAVADPPQAGPEDRITLRLQVVVPAFAGLADREEFHATLMTATSASDRHAVAAAATVAGADDTMYFKQPHIDQAATRIRALLETVVADESAAITLDSDDGTKLLWDLAQEGRILYEKIGQPLEQRAGGRFTRLQLVQTDASAFIPIEFAYGLPAPANGAGLCGNWQGALDGIPCTEEHHRENRLGHLEVVCPSGFWGVSKVIERQIRPAKTPDELAATDFGLWAEPTVDRPSLPPIRQAVFAWSEILNNARPGTSAAVLKSLASATHNQATPAKTWLEWVEAIDHQRPDVLVLLSHTVDSALEIGAENSHERATPAQINPRFVKKLKDDSPIVFLLGCTTAVADAALVSFVGRLRDLGAAIVVGTITPVLGERSAALVETVMEKLAQKRRQPIGFGDVMLETRRTLLAKGELTALCAASFGDASWLVS